MGDIIIQWRNVLDTKMPGARREDMNETAIKLGYRLFVYSGRLWVADEHGPVDTGVVVGAGA